MPETPLPDPRITDVAHLRELLGEPIPRVRDKDRDRLAPEDLAWIAASPLVLVGTSAPDGTCDVSPKGDPAGFVHVVDDRTLAIPERPGNRRADGFVNMLANPHVGLLFLVPGRGDTLRVTGRTTLLTDAPYADALVVDGHRPVVICEVAVETVFFHCPKAFMRSHLWQPDTWAPDTLPTRAAVAHRLERPDQTLAALEDYYGPRYADQLY